MPCIRWTSTFVFLRSQREGSQERDRREEGGRGRKPADKRNRWWQMSSKAGHPAKYLSDGQRSAARPATACTEQSFGWNASQESENSAAQPVLRGVRLDASPTTQEEEMHKQPGKKLKVEQCCKPHGMNPPYGNSECSQASVGNSPAQATRVATAYDKQRTSKSSAAQPVGSSSSSSSSSSSGSSSSSSSSSNRRRRRR